LNNNNVQKSLKISVVVSDLSAKDSYIRAESLRPFYLAKALKKLGHKVEILGLAFEESSPSFYEPDIPMVYLPCQYYSGIINAAKELLSKINGDIIYAHKLKTTSFGISVLKKLSTRKSLILDIDNWELNQYGGNDWKYRPSFQQFIKDIFQKEGGLRYVDHPLYLKWLEGLQNFADIILTSNRFLEDNFGGIYFPSGIDTDLFNADKYNSQKSKEKYGLVNYKVLMLTDIMKPNQGIEDYLKSLDILQQADLRFAFLESNYENDYEKVLTEKWGKWLIKLPQVSFNTIPEIMAAADIMVIPQGNNSSCSTLFPIQLVEAMAMGKPIIATAVGDSYEILADSGCLVEPSAPEQILYVLQLILNNQNMVNTQTKKARDRCLKYYSLDSMASRWQPIVNLLGRVIN
jgi:glycosyltransferase involved in cell wall biosynthesis